MCGHHLHADVQGKTWKPVRDRENRKEAKLATRCPRRFRMRAMPPGRPDTRELRSPCLGFSCGVGGGWGFRLGGREAPWTSLAEAARVCEALHSQPSLKSMIVPVSGLCLLHTSQSAPWNRGVRAPVWRTDSCRGSFDVESSNSSGCGLGW